MSTPKIDQALNFGPPLGTPEDQLTAARAFVARLEANVVARRGRPEGEKPAFPDAQQLPALLAVVARLERVVAAGRELEADNAALVASHNRLLHVIRALTLARSPHEAAAARILGDETLKEFGEEAANVADMQRRFAAPFG